MALLVAAILDPCEEYGMAARAHLGVAELASGRALHASSQLRGHRLHAVADTQDRHPQFEHHWRRLEILDFVDRIRAAGKNDALRVEVANEGVRDVVGMQLAIHLLLAHTTSDQLRDLRAKVENQDLLMGHGGLSNGAGGLPPPADCQASIAAHSTW